MRKSLMLFICMGALAMPLPVVAQDQNGPSYSRDEVVKSLIGQKKHFTKSKAVCIGLDSECGAVETRRAGFDMMLTFEFDSAELTDEAKRNLDVISQALQDRELGSATFLIEGHTDATGNDRYNLTLSKNRANSVKSYLRSRNVAGNRLRAKGYGEKRPRVADAYAADNRRVELKLQSF